MEWLYSEPKLEGWKVRFSLNKAKLSSWLRGEICPILVVNKVENCSKLLEMPKQLSKLNVDKKFASVFQVFTQRLELGTKGNFESP